MQLSMRRAPTMKRASEDSTLNCDHNQMQKIQSSTQMQSDELIIILRALGLWPDEKGFHLNSVNPLIGRFSGNLNAAL